MSRETLRYLGTVLFKSEKKLTKKDTYKKITGKKLMNVTLWYLPQMLNNTRKNKMTVLYSIGPQFFNSKRKKIGI
jgi:hypothetical protein